MILYFCAFKVRSKGKGEICLIKQTVSCAVILKRAGFYIPPEALNKQNCTSPIIMPVLLSSPVDSILEELYCSIFRAVWVE